MGISIAVPLLFVYGPTHISLLFMDGACGKPANVFKNI